VHPVQVDVVFSRLSDCSQAAINDLRLAPPPFGSPGYRFPKNFVAMTMRSRRVRLLPIVALPWDGV